MSAVLADLATSPWAYLAIGLFVATDVYLPVLPSGTLVAMTAAYTSTQPATLGVLLIYAAVLSLIGDLAARRTGVRHRAGLVRAAALSRAVRSGHDALADMLRTRLVTATLVGRFLPAGRTVIALTAGEQGLSGRRFAPAAALAGLIWAGYAVAVGKVSGGLVDGSPLGAPLLIVVTLGLTVPVVCRVLMRPRYSGTAEPVGPHDQGERGHLDSFPA